MSKETFAETYSSDYKLITALGLKTFKVMRDKRGLGNNPERYLGTIRYEKRSVRVYITPLPAQFYRFVVKDGKHTYQLQAGSGLFSKWFPMIKDILDGMIDFESIKK